MTTLRGQQAIGKITGVSPLNYAPEVRKNMHLPSRVVVDDLTLREGRQLEGLSLNVDECVRIALELQELGVPMIQIANWSENDAPVLNALGKLNLKMKTETMTAAHQVPPFTTAGLFQAADRALENGLGLVPCLALGDGILRAMGDARGQKDKSLDYLKKQEIDIAVKVVTYVKERGGFCDVNLQDYLRCDFDHMANFCRAMVEAKCDVIILDDICGPAIPAAYKYGMEVAKAAVPDAVLGVHVHNDFGLALPAVLGALEGGCEVITCGINGHGERAGHADLCALVADLEFLYGFDTGIKLEKLTESARVIGDIVGRPVSKWAPIVGDLAFSHIYDWHWEFDDYPWAVSALEAHTVGNVTKPILGEGSGPYVLQMKARELGMDIPTDKVSALQQALNDRMRWSKRPPTNDEFRKIVERLS